MRHEIIKTALGEFLKNGIRKMTIQKLVEPMGISTKTVYKFFVDKEDLLKECIALQYSMLFEKFYLVRSDSTSAVAKIFKILHEGIKTDFGSNHIFYHDLNYYYPQLQDQVLKKYVRRYHNEFAVLMKKGIEDGLIKNDIIPELVLETLTTMYTAITRTQQYKKFKLQPFIIFKNTIEMYLRGICTSEGLKELDKNTYQ
jgi:AcrR family transcriptional regulator